MNFTNSVNIIAVQYGIVLIIFLLLYLIFTKETKGQKREKSTSH